MRLDPPHRKPGWYMIMISPGFLYLAFLLGVVVACVLALYLLTDPVLLSTQGGI
jgi:hypothetical protein